MLQEELLEVKIPIGAMVSVLSSFFEPKAEIYLLICSSEHEKTFAPTLGNLETVFVNTKGLY